MRPFLIFYFIICLYPLTWGKEIGGQGLTLNDYLSAVKIHNPSARALITGIEAAKVKIDRADLNIMPEAYGQYNIFDDRTPPLNPKFTPNRRKGYNWKFGVQQQTNFGLSGNLYFEDNQLALFGVDPLFFPINNYTSNRAVLELKQALWRNGFGEQTRADLKAATASAKADLYNQQFKLKNLLLEAENAYWAMVIYNEIVDLQEENVKRAKELSDWMGRRVKVRLFDDVDGLQAYTAYETRQLELQSSLNERASVARNFNTLRGIDSDSVEPLKVVPQDRQTVEANGKDFKMTREDFLALKELAKVQENRARSERSNYRPQVDFVGSVASNGLDPKFAGAYSQIKNWDHPSWSIGVQVKFPLNFSLNGRLFRAAAQDIDAAAAASENADFQMKRTWQEISQKQDEYQQIYTKAKKIEDSQKSLLTKERQQLRNGRTTTFQLLNFEQNLVAAQIQRTRAQLGLLQIKNLLKTFEASNESL